MLEVVLQVLESTLVLQTQPILPQGHTYQKKKSVDFVTRTLKLKGYGANKQETTIKRSLAIEESLWLAGTT